MKYLAGLVAAALTATTFAVAAPATADHGGYGAHVDTETSAWSMRNPVKAGQRAPFAVRVTAQDGNQPNSQLTIRVERRVSGKVVWRGTRAYTGGRGEYKTGPLPRGRFDVFVFTDTNWGKYHNSKALFGQRATR
jgi:hypothetical protein